MLYDDLKEWKRQAKKLEDYYDDIESLAEDAEEIFKGNCAIVVVSAKKLISVRPNFLRVGDENWHISRDSILYKIEDDGSLHKIDTEEIIDELVEYLSDKITVEKLMKDVLNKLEPDDLFEIYERAIIKKGKVREEEGCYKLLVGGKKGRPFEVFIVD